MSHYNNKDLEMRFSNDKISFFEFNRLLKTNRFCFANITVEEWDQQQKNDFIENLLTSITLPTIYLVENQNGQRIIFNGYNELKTLIDFFNNKFKLDNLLFFPYFNDCYFDDLSTLKQALFEDKMLNFVIIQPPTDLDTCYHILNRFSQYNFISKNEFLTAFNNI